MRGELRLLFLLLWCGCDETVCTRHSDCSTGYCSAQGLCTTPPVQSDGGDDMGLDLGERD